MKRILLLVLALMMLSCTAFAKDSDWKFICNTYDADTGEQISFDLMNPKNIVGIDSVITFTVESILTDEQTNKVLVAAKDNGYSVKLSDIQRISYTTYSYDNDKKIFSTDLKTWYPITEGSPVAFYCDTAYQCYSIGKLPIK